ncbi:MAG: ribonuclease HIII [Erysipelotrichaceae bacterium]|nr:ribonuclease HIII [Erysipelotrichaceae bacterium]
MQQTTITLKVSNKTKEQMIDFFEDLKREKTPPYAIFQAQDGDTVVTLYESGKAVFQGHDADLSSDFWIETEKINSGKAITTDSREKKKEEKIKKVLPIRINSIGSDEVGTGDYFGPIVVTASYVAKENIDFLLDLKVKDSKKLTDEQILKIVPQIIKKIPYQTYILNNKDYNNYKMKNMNMNQMKAILHNKVLYEIKQKNFSYDYIVVDQFEPPKSYFNHISKSTKKVQDIFFLTKAEDQCLSVACSSLISRYIFLKEMDKLSNNLGFTLPKGANPQVDEIGKKIIKIYGKEKLEQVAKLNFKNTEKILNS